MHVSYSVNTPPAELIQELLARDTGGSWADSDDGAAWLGDTPVLQWEHPRIRILAKRLTQLEGGPVQKARACFAFVWSLPFAFDATSMHTTAPEVLQRGYGDCRTKSTLFVAMLRSLGIPARVRFVSLPPHFLRGLLNTAGATFDHAFAEVFMDDLWLGVDTYSLDIKLALAARSLLGRENRRVGYGVHLDGQVGWDGKSSAFGQFNASDKASAPSRDWGPFNDPSEFARIYRTGTKRGWSAWPRRSIGLLLANRRVAELRHTR
jgi:hypothetical protein